ncbi:MAG: MBL fold metallo-hydrolase [Candidatus Methanofastidiosum sp.]|nr:MBL fold metallo-hydrolase [Methanofastidiosum sp.]
MSHSFFKIETQGKIIAIDPFSEDAVGIKPSRFKADIALSTHNHNGHNNIDLIMGDPFILNTPGEIEINNIFIKGIKTNHDNGATLSKNTVFVVDSEDIRLVHLGDFGEKKIKDDLLEKMGDVDILLIPIAGSFRENPASEAVDLIKKIEPRIIIPMHYSKEESVNKFVKEIGLTPEKMDKLNIRKNHISQDEESPMRLIILQS